VRTYPTSTGGACTSGRSRARAASGASRTGSMVPTGQPSRAGCTCTRTGRSSPRRAGWRPARAATSSSSSRSAWTPWTGARAGWTRRKGGTAPSSASPCRRRRSACASSGTTGGPSGTACAWCERQPSPAWAAFPSRAPLAVIVLVVPPVGPVPAAVPPVPLEVHVVEHRAEHGCAHVAELVHGVGQRALVGLCRACDDEHAVGVGAEHGRVGHQVERRRVEEDRVVAFLEPLEQGVHALRAQQL